MEKASLQPRPVTAPATELAWAAGFIDGEGCFYFSNPATRPNANIGLTVSQCDRRPLDRLAAIFGRNVNGPREGKGNHRSHYTWAMVGFPSVQHLVCHLWPYMSRPKQEQYIEASRQFRALWKPRERMKKTDCEFKHGDMRYLSGWWTCWPCALEASKIRKRAWRAKQAS